MRNAKLPYRIVRPLAKIALATNFRKIYFSNAQVIPKDKPVIIAANHPSAFMEPCILAVLLPMSLHFLVRGDFFKRPLFNKILRALHMLPIYRMKDGGYKKIKDNFSTFDQCYATLAESKVIMILAEGTTVHEKRLRPLQKGAARLALGTLEKYPELDPQIVPVGVNYTASDQFRSHAMIEFGQPIAAKEYIDEYQIDQNLAIKNLTDRIRGDLQKHIVIIASREDEALVEKLFAINRNNWQEPSQPSVSKNNRLLKSEKKIADTVNTMKEEDKKVLEVQTDEYLENLNKTGLEDFAISVGKMPETKNWLVIIFGFFPFLFGFAGNFLPLKIADIIINKKVKVIEFRSSVKITTAIFLYLLYFFLLFILLLVLGMYSLVFVLFALPFFGYYAILYMEYFQRWRVLRKLTRVPLSDLEKFQEMREAILAGFQ
ncbi:MAG: glycerol-3-phosphate O-acyltransferase/dihydroxyacetone phosphate acyltransferase [Saprospiraceae bacterium]